MKPETNAGRPSLRNTLLRWLLIPLLSLLLMSSIIAYGIALNFARDEFDRALYESAEDIAQLVVRNAAEGKPEFQFPKLMRDLILVDQRNKLYYNIRDMHGLLINGDSEIDSPPHVPEGKIPRSGLFYADEVKGNKVRVVSLPLVVTIKGDETLLFIQVAETLEKRKLLAEKILTDLIFPQFLLVILVAVVVWFAVGHSLRQLSKLAALVATRSHLDLSPLQPDDAPQEVQSIVSAINALLHRLKTVLDTQSRLIADAAHQLRTPLAGMKAQIDLAARQDTPEEVHHSLGQLNVGAKRLNHMVNQLLSLARNEPGADISLHFEPIDLNALARGVTVDWAPTAFKRNIDLGFEDAHEPVWVNGDSLRLQELLNNLLDNALRYTQKGGGGDCSGSPGACSGSRRQRSRNS